MSDRNDYSMDARRADEGGMIHLGVPEDAPEFTFEAEAGFSYCCLLAQSSGDMSIEDVFEQLESLAKFASTLGLRVLSGWARTGSDASSTGSAAT